MNLPVFLEERVLGHYHDGFLLTGLEDALGHIFLVNDQAEGILVEPVVSHDDVAMVAAVAAPGVLHFPLDGLAAGIEIDGGERHGVSGAAVEGGDALGLVHAKCGAKEGGVVKVVECQVAVSAVELLATS